MDIEALTRELVRDERFVPHAYRDSRGYLTIGIGRMVDSRLGGGITLDEAKFLLAHDIARVTAALEARLPYWLDLDDARQRALANMAFNLGIPRLMEFRRMFAALADGDYDTAAAEALDSRWARQVGARADRIAAMIRTGQ